VQLLKIDVERAELDVLRGVEARDRPRVEQVAVEVHEALLDDVVELLKTTAKFTKVECEQADACIGPGVFMVWATRK